MRPLLVGDAHVIEKTAERLKVDTPAFIDAPALEEAAFAPGELDPRAGKATVAYDGKRRYFITASESCN